jgi:phosphatidate cytidylyltransferase
MLASRVLVTIILLPIGLALIVIGGWPFSGLIALFMTLAAWEYVQLFRTGGYQPAGVLIVAGTLLVVVGRAYNGFESAPWIISLIVLGGLTYHLVSYERGRDAAAADFSATLAGALYIGWTGAYLVSLRAMPDGKWWILVVLPAVWFADSGAYLIGSRFGRHKLSPRLSPKKTWEGFIAGLVFGTLGGALLAAACRLGAGPASAITASRGALLGFVLALLTPLGDLGESMIKRQFGAKDSGRLLPGHGGAFDRVDSWLWAGVLGYYIIVWFFAS